MREKGKGLMKQLILRLLVTALALGLVIVVLGWGRAHPHWYNPFRSREDQERAANFFSWIPPWAPLCDIKDSMPCRTDEEKCRCPEEGSEKWE